MLGYRTLSLDDVEAHHDPDSRADWLPLRHVLDVRAFGINAWRAPEAGAEVIERHDEADCAHEEVYVVLSGSARFTVGGDEFDAPARTVVFVQDAAPERAAIAREPGTLILTVGAARGVAFTVSGWEGRALAAS